MYAKLYLEYYFRLLYIIWKFFIKKFNINFYSPYNKFLVSTILNPNKKILKSPLVKSECFRPRCTQIFPWMDGTENKQMFSSLHCATLHYNCLIIIFLENFNLWRLLLKIALYHQTKTPISFWCRRGLNPRSFIQLSKTLPVELTGIHTIIV